MEMFRFAHPEYLYFGALIPMLMLAFIAARLQNKNNIRKFGNPVLLAGLMPFASGSRPIFKFILKMTALALLIIGIAQPQFGSKLKTVKKKGIELVIALDVSNSMMAGDIQPNRLEYSKRLISKLVDRMTNDKIGLIVFAGDAYIQLPITTDYASAKLFLSTVNTGIVPKQGTAIGAAISLAARSFSPQSEGSKAIVVITDGENHEDDAISAATDAAEKEIKIYTLGMGSEQGAPIPILKSNGESDFRRDKTGKIVVTKLNVEMLQQIAAAGDGGYISAANAQAGLNALFNELSKLEKKELESKIYADYDDQFQYFIAFALFLLLVDFLILERKNKQLMNFRLFKVKE